ncbi:MAG: formylglycine-generating enzyme family protein [Alphaproteobacteria bacterium]|nr:formylglycine-generating enzyme family protein [Alphaproteobacteria bacterium]
MTMQKFTDTSPNKRDHWYDIKIGLLVYILTGFLSLLAALGFLWYLMSIQAVEGKPLTLQLGPIAVTTTADLPAWPTWVRALVSTAAQDMEPDCADGCPELVRIPAGQFVMGSPTTESGRDSDESPTHTVMVSAPLAVGRYLVTRGEYARFIAAKGARPRAGCTVTNSEGTFINDAAADWKRPGFRQTDRDPVTCVSWDDAQAYVKWLQGISGKAYRLLPEAEWEYAARAGTTDPWYWGKKPSVACRYANLADRKAGDGHSTGDADFVGCSDGFEYTSPVDQFWPNGFYLFDMAGNVFQWVADCYHDTYNGTPRVASSVPDETKCDKRVIRGGAWTSSVKQARSASRLREQHDHHGFNVGFRVARDIDS